MMHTKLVNVADKNFVDKMAPHHQAAIDMAKVELKSGKNPEIRQMARNVIKAQKKEITEMKAWQSKNETRNTNMAKSAGRSTASVEKSMGKSKVIAEKSAPFVKGGNGHMAGFTGSGSVKPGKSTSDALGKKGYSPAKGGKGHMAGFMGSSTVKPGVSEAASHAPRGPASGMGRKK